MDVTVDAPIGFPTVANDPVAGLLSLGVAAEPDDLHTVVQGVGVVLAAMLLGHDAAFVVLPFFRVDTDGGWACLFDVGGHGVFVLVVASTFGTLWCGKRVAGNISACNFELLAPALVSRALAGVLVVRFAGHAPG